MSSSDGMLMKGKSQGEFGSVLGLDRFIARVCLIFKERDTAGQPRGDYLIDI